MIKIYRDRDGAFVFEANTERLAKWYNKIRGDHAVYEPVEKRTDIDIDVGTFVLCVIVALSLTVLIAIALLTAA